MKLKDFKEWLNQFPDDTIVKVSVSQRINYATYCSFEQFNPDEYHDFHSTVGNPRIKPDDHRFNKSILHLGSN